MTRLANSLPNLIILGAAKAGTTTLFHTLCQHDQIFGSIRKEPKFFSNDEFFSKGLDWYAESFFSGSENYPIRLEATPLYLALSPITSQRIKILDQYTSPKFIVVFREPVSRAYSHYWMERGKGKDKLSFEEAIAKELKDTTVPTQQDKIVRGTSFNYLRNGDYGSLIRPFLNSFGRRRILFLFFEDLVSKPESVFANILTFLQVNTSFEFELLHKNKASRRKNRKLFSFMEAVRKTKPFRAGMKVLPPTFKVEIQKNYIRASLSERDYPPISERMRTQLRNYYREEMISLQKITGRDLSHWYRADA